MLLEFKTENYKSFAEEMCFSMTPAPKQKGLDYSILSAKIGAKVYKGLCSAVIYGPNAAGKTNIIGAMDTFREIILRGNINNSDRRTPNVAASALELVPNCNSESKPTKFAVKFIDDGFLFDYSISADLGPFMWADYDRNIFEEKLLVNGQLVFQRDKNLTVEFPSVIKKYVNTNVARKKQTMLEIAQSSLACPELFLTNGFKSIYSQKLVSRIINWFTNKFIVIYHSEDLRLVRSFTDPKENAVYVEKTLTEAAKEFGISSNALGYKTSNGKEDEESVLFSIFNNTKMMLPAEVFESYGTIRFITEFPLVIRVLLNGGTLVMDEFDASIHPMALMNIITIFHNDEINKNNAQLIFNTHNPIFLDASLLRRDEIKFVERDEKTGYSTHYSLSDFKTADGVRKGEDYMNNYFVSRYGAIKDIDFSPILEQIISEQQEDGN